MTLGTTATVNETVWCECRKTYLSFFCLLLRFHGVDCVISCCTDTKQDLKFVKQLDTVTLSAGLGEPCPEASRIDS